ncbi:MAG: hypothetical protein PW788_01495 [Micavibrio sp.]|nr:hypothetical protein [Micavibrio sp.]
MHMRFLAAAGVAAALTLMHFSASAAIYPVQYEAPGADDGTAAEAPQAGGAGADPDTTITINSAALGDDRPYQAALKTLSPQQQQLLGKLDDDAVKTVEPDIQVLDMAGKLHYCFQSGKIAADQQKEYATAFLAFQGMAKAAQQPLLEQQSGMRDQVTFMDRQLLEDHAKYQSNMMLAMAGQLMQVAEKKGGFQKTDCAEVQQKLDAAAQNTQQGQ